MNEQNLEAPDCGEEARPEYLNIADRVKAYLCQLDITYLDLLLDADESINGVSESVEKNFNTNSVSKMIFNLMLEWEQS